MKNAVKPAIYFHIVRHNDLDFCIVILLGINITTWNFNLYVVEWINDTEILREKLFLRFNWIKKMGNELKDNQLIDKKNIENT